MRRALALVAVIVLGVGLGVGAVNAAEILDARWQPLGAAMLFVPRSVSADTARPVRVVLVLPGLGGNGRDLGDLFADAAEAERWLLVAPSPAYDPIFNESLEGADLRVDEQLVALVDVAAARSPSPVTNGIGIVGFSRGAQQGHRFALRHADRVTVLACFSAGTYTMPTSALAYPLGVGNFEFWNHGHALDIEALKHVSVFVGVGALDENAADVPRAWDDVGGTTRVARAASFYRALRDLGVPVTFKLYPNTRHVFTTAMHDDAVKLLRGS